MDAAIFNFLELNLFPKKSGIVDELICWVIILVFLPKTAQAKKEPTSALPIPIQNADTPNAYPKDPAYPINTTALKYEVP